MPTGTIKKLVSDRGFGFIAAEDGREYFFHRTGLDASVNFDVDARNWPAVGKRDPVVARLQHMFPGFRPVNWSNAYEAAAWSLVSTRIAMRQAQGVKDRMSREIGHEVDVHGHHLWVFPEPSRLIELKSFKGLFGRKVEYLKMLG